MKIKVAFYHPDANFIDVDCTMLESGNPGIGGSEYALLLIAEKLAKCSQELDVFLITQSDNKRLPDAEGKLTRLVAHNEKELFDTIIDNKIDILTVRYGIILPSFKSNSDFYEKAEGKFKIVLWNQNFIYDEDIDYFSKSSSVSRLVCVGKEQMDLLLDSVIYDKLEYIYNCLPNQLIQNSRKNIQTIRERPKNVVYMGSLTPAKSFDVLAKAWPEILKEEPDANLYVIGSGQVYDRTQKLGKYGIAEESYEEKFMGYLVDKNDTIIPSVHFMGLMGQEKDEILRNSRVGVPNPTGLSETFCICGIEMQLAGCLLTSMKCPGYLDTFYPGTSLLYKSTNKLSQSVVKLLRMSDPKKQVESIDFVDQKFNLDIIYIEWEALFLKHLWDGTHIHPNVVTNLGYRLKWLKYVNRGVKRFIPFGYVLLPTIESLIILYIRFKVRIIQLVKRLQLC